MLANNNIPPTRRTSDRAGWAVAGAVVVLMASLVYFTNGRSGPVHHGNATHAAVQLQR